MASTNRFHTIELIYTDPDGTTHHQMHAEPEGDAPHDGLLQKAFGAESVRLKRREWLARKAGDLGRGLGARLGIAAGE